MHRTPLHPELKLEGKAHPGDEKARGRPRAPTFTADPSLPAQEVACSRRAGRVSRKAQLQSARRARGQGARRPRPPGSCTAPALRTPRPQCPTGQAASTRSRISAAPSTPGQHQSTCCFIDLHAATWKHDSIGAPALKHPTVTGESPQPGPARPPPPDSAAAAAHASPAWRQIHGAAPHLELRPELLDA